MNTFQNIENNGIAYLFSILLIYLQKSPEDVEYNNSVDKHLH